MYKCNICGKEFKVQQAQASHIYHAHSSKEAKQKAREKQSKTTKLERVIITKQCKNCGHDFEVERTVNKDGIQHINKKEKQFCCRPCANTKTFTEEQNKSKGRKGEFNKAWKGGIESRMKPCVECGKAISHTSKYGYCRTCLSKQPFYREMLSKAIKGKTGGLREGSVKSYRSGRYNGIWFDSSWELAYYLYNKEHDIDIERNSESFNYEYDGEMHKYYPDFIVEGSYIEIKGREQPETQAKLDQFPHKIEILRREEMKPILQYIENKYDKKFWLKFYI